VQSVLLPKVPTMTRNYQRLQTADMTGKVILVTGGRLKIGYEIVVKLLRANAMVFLL
jgi:FlaA1/EpsC-like NDP-sugar epimerase